RSSTSRSSSLSVTSTRTGIRPPIVACDGDDFDGRKPMPADYRLRSLVAPVGAPEAFAIIAITMAQLLVRDIESDVVRELKIRAARHGRSAEEEHRQILRDALRGHGRAKPLKELLLEMPDVGEDRDFEPPEDLGRPVEL
ncbi:MAG TPA: hypothetical protein VFN85_11165, partial [Solirubrobacterales bacterium]|nr:hypothetical protein [Solirubrobacterales bacterium]